MVFSRITGQFIISYHCHSLALSLSLSLSLQLSLTHSLSPGLIYCGVTVILISLMGLWVASTAHKDIVFYYYFYCLPALTSLLLAAAGISLSGIADTNKNVIDKFDTLVLPNSGYGSKADDVQVTPSPARYLILLFSPYFLSLNLCVHRERERVRESIFYNLSHPLYFFYTLLSFTISC